MKSNAQTRILKCNLNSSPAVRNFNDCFYQSCLWNKLWSYKKYHTRTSFHQLMLHSGLFQHFLASFSYNSECPTDVFSFQGWVDCHTDTAKIKFTQESDTKVCFNTHSCPYITCCWWGNSYCLLAVSHCTVNSSPPGQNGRHFADNIFRCIFVNEKICILIKISLRLFLSVQLTINQHWFT